MSGTQTPVRIEIVDPVGEPLESGWIAAASASTPAEGIDEWIRSLSDAGVAARRHVEPITRLLGRWSDRVGRVLWSIRGTAMQVRNDGSPRRSSAVRQHVFEPYDRVAERLPGAVDSLVAARGVALEFSSPFAPAPAGGQQALASLSFRGSWPRLPMVVRVEPWWRDQSVVTVELRTRRRLRYPRRYFRGAHAAARAIGRALSG